MHALKEVLEFLAQIIDYIGVSIVLYGFLLSLGLLVRTELMRFSGGWSLESYQRLRLTLGTYILLGIEFMIASDIIHAVLSREVDDLIFVSALVAIRTAISFFLGRELNEVGAGSVRPGRSAG